MSWDSYAAMITNTLDPETNQYTVTGVGTSGAIYGEDGTKWGCTEGFELYAYEFEVGTGEEIEVDGKMVEKTVKADVNEVTIVKDLFDGKTSGGDAGLRMNNNKYMFLRKEGDYIYLSRKGGGGAILTKAKGAILIGVWDPNNKDSNGLTQNPGDMLKNLEVLVEYLNSTLA